MSPESEQIFPESKQIFPESKQILAECSEDVLSKLSFFRIRDGRPVATFLEESQLFQQNDHLEQLLGFSLIHEEIPTPSFIFYRERMEDFVFVRCEEEIMAYECKIKSLEGHILHEEMPHDEYMQKISHFHDQITHLNDLKQVFSILFVNSAEIPSNERYADADRCAKKAVLKILISYHLKEQSLPPQINQNQGEMYFQFLKQKGFWREYTPTRCFTITKLGMDVLELLRNKDSNILSPEEVEFEKIVQDMNRLDTLKKR